LPFRADHGPANGHDVATAPGTGQVWATDITYVPTDEGRLYVVGVLHLYSRIAQVG
jgi:transposase InsO family protein